MAPGFWQIVIVLLIVLLLFGTKRLRNIGSDLGSAIKGFRRGMSDSEDDSVDSEPGKLGRDAAPRGSADREQQRERHD